MFGIKENGSEIKSSLIPLHLLCNPAMRLQTDSAVPLPNNKCAFLSTVRGNARSLSIIILCLETGEIQHTIFPDDNESSIIAMTAIDDRFLIATETCGKIFIHDLQERDPKKSREYIGNWVQEGLLENLPPLMYLPQTKKIVTSHGTWMDHELAVWDIDQHKFSKKIRLPFGGAKVKLLNSTVVLVACKSAFYKSLYFYSVDLVTSNIKSLFNRENVLKILKMEIMENKTVIGIEWNINSSTNNINTTSNIIFRESLTEDRFSIQANLLSLFKPLSNTLLEYGFSFLNLFKQSTLETHSLAVTPKGYATCMADGSIHFYSEENKLIYSISTLKQDIKDRNPVKSISWDPYNGSVIYYYRHQVVVIKLSQAYQDVLQNHLTPQLVNIVLGYLGWCEQKIFSHKKPEEKKPSLGGGLFFKSTLVKNAATEMMIGSGTKLHSGHTHFWPYSEQNGELRPNRVYR